MVKGNGDKKGTKRTTSHEDTALAATTKKAIISWQVQKVRKIPEDIENLKIWAE